MAGVNLDKAGKATVGRSLRTGRKRSNWGMGQLTDVPCKRGCRRLVLAPEGVLVTCAYCVQQILWALDRRAREEKKEQ